MKVKWVSLPLFFILLILQCSPEIAGNRDMVVMLKNIRTENYSSSNMYYPESRLTLADSLIRSPSSSENDMMHGQYMKGNILLESGKEKEAIRFLERVARSKGRYHDLAIRDLAVAYLRLGERTNCIVNHSAESCIIPVRGAGIYQDMEPTRKAIALYESIVEKNPSDLESMWLINIAYMTLGEYPEQVPPAYLIPGMEGDTTVFVRPFEDIAGGLQLDVRNMAGGSIAEDFDNDGYLDLVTSGWGLEEKMHYFRNNGDGTFTDLSGKSGLSGFTGGLNIMQTDYNNDGYRDIFVLRGAWKRLIGHEPNSLLKNNGDGTFSDVTAQSGLLSLHPTQTATWNDFNNDGWLDVFIGNESGSPYIDDYVRPDELHPCELYINNQDGTFRNIAKESKSNVVAYVKGVASGDFNNDGWKDIYLSTTDGKNTLLKNNGLASGEISFEDVTESAGLVQKTNSTFPTWFWDYNNDGWLDIFVCDYSYTKSLSYYTAAEKLNFLDYDKNKMFLYQNNGDGTFTNVAQEAGLDQYVFAMGCNFGDINNDGFLDMYLGTGNPLFQSLVPNKMFLNMKGKKFADVTHSARVGHLQKGHGTSFADMDNDGDQDIYIDMGGALPGDAYQSAFFLNPGQNANNWISLELKGKESNRAAVGTKIKLTIREGNVVRHIYRDVNSGGSFGSSPFRREIGIGKAKTIERLEISWHGGGSVQVFENIQPERFIRITEGEDRIEDIRIEKISWTLPDRLCYPDDFNLNRTVIGEE